MKHWKVKLSLFLNYFVFAILLNSVGTVILQVQTDFGITESAASVLEGYKDLSIAIASFLIASYIPKFGYRRSMLAGLLFVTVGAVLMPLVKTFVMTKILFACVGVSFALIKVSVYSTVSLVTEGPNEHGSYMNMLEGIFKIGELSLYWLFGFFIGSAAFTWLDTYWVLAVASTLAFVLLLFTSLDESEVQAENQDTKKSFLEMIGLVRFKLVLLFIAGIFLYVYIEQAITTWMPTFNNKILQLPNDMSVQIVSILAATTALGRLATGAIMKVVSWFWVLIGSLVGTILMVILVLPFTGGVEAGSVTGWVDAPFAAYIFPLIGLFLAPIYPTLSSSILSKLPKAKQSGMTGLIVIFSALGGTTGSIFTGFMFGKLDGITAFYLTLIPMAIMVLILFPYRRIRSTFEFENLTE
jgi:fucose permease